MLDIHNQVCFENFDAVGTLFDDNLMLGLDIFSKLNLYRLMQTRMRMETFCVICK